MTGLSLLTERGGACQSAADSYGEIRRKLTACPFSSDLSRSDSPRRMANVSPKVCLKRIGWQMGVSGHISADICLPIGVNGRPAQICLKK
ncbi:hypothetical protein AB205_0148620 [Aquarana catesbeiana]|uniref:Uncharacterized protein n=1 Tax=Aquarana catesbeiana TaxID=8400 RepID=A0A2G9S440_AQUCT|nr:hypothetical protein AB205_0148620 [Aquarana catesbeiana]